MTMQKAKRKAYNDGVLWVVDPPTEQTDFGAVKNQTKASALNKLLKLSFHEMSRRDSDIEFAESMGRQLSLKVKTIHHPAADAAKDVLIGDMLYSIVKLDVDRQMHEMYLYLEEVRRLT